MIRLAALPALGVLATPCAALAQDCDLLPPEVEQSSAYSGWSERRLCEAGQDALYAGLPEGVEQVTRFTFTHGHSSFFRFVTLTERTDGRVQLEYGGGGIAGGNPRSHWIDRPTRHRRLSAEEAARLHALVEESGTFEHAIGTWDGVGDEQEIYLHCEVLEMEQATPQDYRFSSVNIGCNQPQRLMPLVEYVMELAHLRFSENRMLIS